MKNNLMWNDVSAFSCIRCLFVHSIVVDGHFIFSMLDSLRIPCCYLLTYIQKTETEHENFWEGQINKLVKNNLSFLFNLMLGNIDNAQGVSECQ